MPRFEPQQGMLFEDSAIDEKTLESSTHSVRLETQVEAREYDPPPPDLIDGEQVSLIETKPIWAEHWTGMPAYDHQDQESWQAVKVHFKNRADRQKFAGLIDQKLTERTRSIWYPQAEIGRMSDRYYEGVSPSIPMNPTYPVYVISKGRWESRLTAKSLEECSIPYRIVIEPQEYDHYAAVIDPSKILVLPFSNLGQGSIPARNWVWDHATESGARRHWILDDNISGFFRYQDNLKCPVGDGLIFRAAEDFSDRYSNVAMSGFNYFMFVTRKSGKIPAITLNTRVYSCILLSNSIPYRWRGRYNEDTDLSLRILKDGRCTILFNAFLCGKTTTMAMSGGNTDELYAGDGRLRMAESLRDQHPDCVEIVQKWGRAQHQVNYKRFRANRLEVDPDYSPVDLGEMRLVIENKDTNCEAPDNWSDSLTLGIT